MSRPVQILLGIIFITLGAAGFIVASFNLKNNAAWISVGLMSVIYAIAGVRLIDNL